MLRRNLDAIAIGIVLFGMAVVTHIPPPRIAGAKVIRFENAVIQNRCTLLDSFLARLQ